MIYEFTPTQDLHGYDSPWPAGGGKNKVNKDSMELHKWVSPNGTNSQNNCAISGKIPVKIGETYTISFLSSTKPYSFEICTFDSNDNYIDREFGLVQPMSKTIESNAAYVIVGISIGNDSSYSITQADIDAIKMMFVEGATAPTAWTPYSNICPPEGYNIWYPTQDKMIQVYAGYVNANTRELYLRPVYQEYAGEELVGPWMSSLDPYEEDSTPTEGAFVIDFGGELTSLEITPFMLQTLLDSLGIRQHFTDGAGLLNKLMDQAQGRVHSEEELLHLSRPLKVIAIGDQLPAGITFKPISKDVLPGLPGKFIR